MKSIIKDRKKGREESGKDSQTPAEKKKAGKSKKAAPPVSDQVLEDHVSMDIKSVVHEVEAKLCEAARERFTGEIRFTFNLSQGGFSTSYVEKERESLIKKKS